MNPVWATWLVTTGGIYAAMGLIFALAFVIKGAATVDPAAAQTGWGFRLLLLPGSIALWPLLAKRWWTALREAQR